MGLSILGLATPAIVEASLAPVIAQKRANNFGEAEALAVSFSAKNEGLDELTGDPPDGCVLDEFEPRAYTVECTVGEGQFIQTVSRSFRLEVELTGYTNPDRQFAFPTPLGFSHVQCPPNDPWGVIWYNEHIKAGGLDACIPTDAWNRNKYLNSNPDDWLFDLSGFGFGQHPDF